MKVTAGKVSEKQGEFRKRKGCVDQTFETKIIVEEYIGKDETLYAAIMDLDKTMLMYGLEIWTWNKAHQ